MTNSSQPNFDFLFPLKPTLVFVTYWKFACERQRIYFKRLQGLPQPWTNDPVLQAHKFTNAYRAADRVSQYLIKNVIYTGDQSPEEVFFRIMLFKLFNKIETWELLQEKIGPISWKDFDYKKYNFILTQARVNGRSIYSAAYIMPSSKGFAHKHEMHLKLLEQMMYDKVALKLSNLNSMKEAYTLLRSYPTLGDFLAYQYVIDINYSTITNFNEMEFIVPGPGAKNGIKKCFSSTGGLTDAEVIELITKEQDKCLQEIGEHFPSLFGRKLQLIDCQNLFCEVDKYSRVVHPEFQGVINRTNIKQKLTPNYSPIIPFFPPKWGISIKNYF